jgi:hypothetical protein
VARRAGRVLSRAAAGAAPRLVEQFVNHRRATLVYLTDGEGLEDGRCAADESYRAAVGRGNTAALCQHDTLLLACATDAGGTLYAPGNHLGPDAAWPVTVHVLAWSSRPITHLALVGPRGRIRSDAPNRCVVEHQWVLEGPHALGPAAQTETPHASGGTGPTGGSPEPNPTAAPAPGWFRVQAFGNQRYWGTAAATNPWFVFPRAPRIADAAFPASSIHHFHANWT